MTPEIFNKCLPRTTTPFIGTGGKPDITWEDVLASLSGVSVATDAFIRYVYLGDENARRLFLLSMKRQGLDDDAIEHWRYKHPGKIDELCILAVREWKFSEPVSAATLAFAMNVSRSDWRRKYQRPYDKIVRYPIEWQAEAIRQMKAKLTDEI